MSSRSKKGLAGVIAARKALDQPNITPAQDQEASGQQHRPPATRSKRFHTTLYLDKEFYGRVKIALIREARDRDFNQLVNELLRKWYEANVDE